MFLDTSDLLASLDNADERHVVSFVIMKQLEIREALTTDHHFEQERFVRLLKPG